MTLYNLDDIILSGKQSCEHPIRITLNGHIHYVPCRHCNSCIKRENSLSSLKCEIESSLASSNIFGTLTYDNYHLPIAEVDISDYNDTHFTITPFNFKSINLSYEKEYEISKYFSKSKGFNKTLEYISRKTGLPFSFLPVPNFSDVQKFFKRLRKMYFEKYGHILEARCYIVSEYGYEHFRPHFHFILHLSGKSRCHGPELIKFIDKCWKLGISHSEIALHDAGCSSYCASYVNSSVILPPLFRVPPIRQKRSHSSFYASKIPLQISYEKFSTFDPRTYIPESYSKDGKIFSINTLGSIGHRFYTKPFGFLRVAYCRTFSLYRGLQDYFSKGYTVIDTARSLHTLMCLNVESCRNHTYLPFYFELYDFKSYPYDDVISSVPPVSRIYSRILSYKRIYNICQSFNINYHSYYNIISNFYKNYEQYKLSQFYQKINTFLTENVSTFTEFSKRVELSLYFYENYNYNYSSFGDNILNTYYFDESTGYTALDYLSSFSDYFFTLDTPNNTHKPFHLFKHIHDEFNKKYRIPMINHSKNYIHTNIKHRDKYKKQIDTCYLINN